MTTRNHLATLLITAAAATFGGWAPDRAAAPEIIVFAGDQLDEPVRTIGYADNHDFMFSLASSQRLSGASPSGGDSVDVYMYWGLHWRACAREPSCLRSLATDRATQRGKLYLGADAAIYVPLDPRARSGAVIVSAQGLSWLEKHGVAP